MNQVRGGAVLGPGFSFLALINMIKRRIKSRIKVAFPNKTSDELV